ncbi:ATP-binding protein [Thalassospira sp. SM2505]
MSAEYEVVSPDAGAMIESMRAFGYDLATALADLVDNSISANAKNIWIEFIWDGAESAILIADDGEGMDEAGLVAAMRMGSISPTVKRSENDLGRFGLGLKTASLSQARCLTVVSLANCAEVVTRCWDLDYIAEHGGGEWRLLKPPIPDVKNHSERLQSIGKGTIVALSKLDRVVRDGSPGDKKAEKRFRERIDEVRAHLSMVFHRYLKGAGALSMFINGARVSGWDPFIEGKSEALAAERLSYGGEKIQVFPFVLPHHSRLTKEEHSTASGPKGWNAQQGFYVYRNRRLIVSGDWLSLGIQKEEHYKLARIQIDLPNSLDEAWHLDVKKARAYPPAAMRDDLKRIARATRDKAAKVYRHRGKVLQRKHADDFVFVWSAKTLRGRTYYKVNRDHPLVKSVRKSCEDGEKFSSLLSMIEQAVPSPLIVINNAEEPDTLGVPFGDDPKGLLQCMREVYGILIQEGETKTAAATKLAVMEPFNAHPDVLTAFLDEINRG